MSNTRFVKPIAILSGVLIAVSIGLGGLWLFGNYVLDAGKEDSDWLENMWGSKYFGSRSDRLDSYELDFIKSLSRGASKEQALIDAVVRGKCYDSSWKCSAIMTTAGNLMLDHGNYQVGLRGAVEAHERIRGQCPVLFESSVTLYHIRTLSSGGQRDAGHRAVTLLRKIKREGGIMEDLRSDECRALARERPEYFTSYALLVASLMELAGGQYSVPAAYLRSLKK